MRKPQTHRARESLNELGGSWVAAGQARTWDSTASVEAVRDLTSLASNLPDLLTSRRLMTSLWTVVQLTVM